jgi:serine phosphatase RsbU (regulator of sigma subunit)
VAEEPNSPLFGGFLGGRLPSTDRPARAGPFSAADRSGCVHCPDVSVAPRSTIAGSPEPVRVLLVEDDAGDALLIRELLGDGRSGFEVVWVRSLREATQQCRLARVDCALVDLGLPDATGLDALEEILAACRETAVVALTGLADRELARRAVAAGAQDYLIKDEVNAGLLDRTIRLAIERRIAERAAVVVAETALRQRHNDRVIRGLLPRLRVDDPGLIMVTRYVPGNTGGLLGGDFLDAVELPDGTVRAIIGDVAGHGPDEAAIGVNLRIAWRVLTLAGTPPSMTFRRLNDQLINDSGLDEIFATAAAVSISPTRDRMVLQIAGHPLPILITDGGATELDVARTTVVGFDVDDVPPEVTIDLPAAWRLLFYTDGLVEGRDGNSRERWGTAGLLQWLATRTSLPPEDLADLLLAEAVRRNSAPLTDDVAILLVAHR